MLSQAVIFSCLLVFFFEAFCVCEPGAGGFLQGVNFSDGPPAERYNNSLHALTIFMLDEWCEDGETINNVRVDKVDSTFTHKWEPKNVQNCAAFFFLLCVSGKILLYSRIFRSQDQSEEFSNEFEISKDAVSVHSQKVKTFLRLQN